MVTKHAPQPFEERLRSWLCSQPLSHLHARHGIARSTLYDWLSGRARPRGVVRFAVLVVIEAWESERDAARRAKQERLREAERRRKPAASPWPQGKA